MSVRAAMGALAVLALAGCVSVPETPSGPTPNRLPSVTATPSPAAPASPNVSPSPVLPPSVPATPPAPAASSGEAEQVRQAYAAEALAGWRAPTPAELGSGRGAAQGITATGDFNGDRTPDRADILVNPSTNEYALFISGRGAPMRVLVGGPLRDVRTVFVEGDQRGLVLEVGGTLLSVHWAGDRYLLQALGPG